MSEWFTSDLHINHKSILQHRTFVPGGDIMGADRRPFNSMEEMNETILHMFDEVRKGDTVYILGDVSWDAEGAKMLFDYLIMKKKVAKIFIIEGNHDHNWMKGFTFHPRVEVCQTMTLKAQPKNGFRAIFLSHYPQIIYDKSHYGAYQLHGHGHADTIDRPLLDALQMGKRLNVNCELHEYQLWSRDEIEKYMNGLSENIDYFLCKGTDSQKKKVKKMLHKINKILKGLNKL